MQPGATGEPRTVSAWRSGSSRNFPTQQLPAELRLNRPPVLGSQPPGRDTWDRERNRLLSPPRVKHNDRLRSNNSDRLRHSNNGHLRSDDSSYPRSNNSGRLRRSNNDRLRRSNNGHLRHNNSGRLRHSNSRRRRRRKSRANSDDRRLLTEIDPHPGPSPEMEKGPGPFPNQPTSLSASQRKISLLP